MAIGGEPVHPGISILDQKKSYMKTIHPIGPARMITTHQPFDLIDVRTKEEFDRHTSPVRVRSRYRNYEHPKFCAIANCRRQSRCMSFAEVVCWLALPAEFLKEPAARTPLL